MSNNLVSLLPVPSSSSPGGSSSQQNVAHVKPMQQFPSSSNPTPTAGATTGVTTSTLAKAISPPKSTAGMKTAHLYQSVNVNVNGVVKSVLIPVTPDGKQIKDVKVIKTSEAGGGQTTPMPPQIAAAPKIITVSAPGTITNTVAPRSPRSLLTSMKQRPAQQMILIPDPEANKATGLQLSLAGQGANSKMFVGSDGKFYMQVDKTKTAATTVVSSKPTLTKSVWVPTTNVNVPTPKPAASSVGPGVKTITYFIPSTKSQPAPPAKATATQASSSSGQNMQSLLPSLKIPSVVPESLEQDLKIDSVFSLSGNDTSNNTQGSHKVIEIAPVDDDPVKSNVQGTDEFKVLAEWEREVTAKDLQQSGPIPSTPEAGSSGGILEEADDIVMSMSQEMLQQASERPSTSHQTPVPVHSSMVSGHTYRRPMPAAIQTNVSKHIITPAMPRLTLAPTHTIKRLPSANQSPAADRPVLTSLIQSRETNTLKRPSNEKLDVMKVLEEAKKPRPGENSKYPMVKKVNKTGIVNKPSFLTKPSKKPPHPTIMNYCHVVLEKYNLGDQQVFKEEDLDKLWKTCPKCPKKRHTTFTMSTIPSGKSTGVSRASATSPISPIQRKPMPITALGPGSNQLLSQADLKGKFLLIKTSAGSFLVPMQQATGQADPKLNPADPKSGSVIVPKLFTGSVAQSIVGGKPQTTKISFPLAISTPEQKQPKPSDPNPPMKVKQEPNTEGYPKDQGKHKSPPKTTVSVSPKVTPGTSLLIKRSPEKTTMDNSSEQNEEAPREDIAAEKPKEPEEPPLTPAERIRRLKEKLKRDEEELQRVNKQREETKRLLMELDDD